ncbi:zinc finger protein 532 [Aplysia californica]|uniref:Zinc finger protein 532 n=1 Tax=Aplysia californica TaxID=6500 RepID=A0ABM0K8Z0_APLCA|nr:zinc finger protein 532 [Aplysia californica]XP_005111700.1 zinc finger protein 532 [Aplysia californica]
MSALSSGSADNGEVQNLLVDPETTDLDACTDGEPELIKTGKDTSGSDSEPLVIDLQQNALFGDGELRQHEATEAHKTSSDLAEGDPVISRSEGDSYNSISVAGNIPDVHSVLSSQVSDLSKVQNSSKEKCDDHDGPLSVHVTAVGPVTAVAESLKELVSSDGNVDLSLSNNSSDTASKRESENSYSHEASVIPSQKDIELSIITKDRETYQSDASEKNSLVQVSSKPMETLPSKDGDLMVEDIEPGEDDEADEADDDVLHIDLTSRCEDNARPLEDNECTSSDIGYRNKILRPTTQCQVDESEQTMEKLSVDGSSLPKSFPAGSNVAGQSVSLSEAPADVSAVPSMRTVTVSLSPTTGTTRSSDTQQIPAGHGQLQHQEVNYSDNSDQLPSSTSPEVFGHFLSSGNPSVSDQTPGSLNQLREPVSPNSLVQGDSVSSLRSRVVDQVLGQTTSSHDTGVKDQTTSSHDTGVRGQVTSHDTGVKDQTTSSHDTGVKDQTVSAHDTGVKDQTTSSHDTGVKGQITSSHDTGVKGQITSSHDSGSSDNSVSSTISRFCLSTVPYISPVANSVPQTVDQPLVSSTDPEEFQPVIVSVRGNCDLGQVESSLSRVPAAEESTALNIGTGTSANAMVVVSNKVRLMAAQMKGNPHVFPEILPKTSDSNDGVLMPFSQQKSLTSLLTLAQKTVNDACVKGSQPVSSAMTLSGVPTPTPPTTSTLVQMIPVPSLSVTKTTSAQVSSTQKTSSTTFRNVLRPVQQSSGLTSVMKVSTDRSTSKKFPHTSNLLASAATTTSQFSCIFLQDPRSVQVKNLAVLIPQKSPSLTSSVLLNKSALPPVMASTATSVSVSSAPLIGATNTHSATSTSTESLVNETPRSLLNKVVTRTLNNFGVERADVLNSDILKVSPAPAEEGDSRNFVCSVCKDKFYSKVGLEYHLHRNIFLMEYFCIYCQKMLYFYNKCRFWMHINAESATPIQRVHNEITHLKVKPQNCYSASMIEDSDPVLMKMLSLEETEKVCRGCNENFPDLASLQDHLIQNPLQKALPCALCQMKLPTPCALKAHTKIHTLTLSSVLDFSCPECGVDDLKALCDNEKTCRPVFDHLDKCSHFNRVTTITCKCNAVFFDEISIKYHFLTKHMQTLYRCSYCAIAFLNDFPKLVSHCQSIHKIALYETQPVLFCSFCNVACKTYLEVGQHLSQHYKVWRATGPQYSRWKCFICQQCFVSKEELKKHADSDHTHKAKRCTLCFSLFSNRQNLVDHIVLKKCKRTLPVKLNLCVDLLDTLSDDIVATKMTELVSEIKSMLARKKNPFSATTPNSTTNNARTVTNTNVVLRKHQAAQPENRFQLRVAFSDTQGLSKAIAGGRKRKIAPKRVNQDSEVDVEPHQCHACKIVIRGAENFSSHLTRHALIGKHISLDVTRCVICKRLVTNAALSAHIQKHQEKGVKICSKCQRRDFKTMKEALDHGNTFCGYTFVNGIGEVVDPGCESTTVSQGEGQTSEGDDNNDIAMGDAVETDVAEGDGNNCESMEDPPPAQVVLFPCLLCGMTFVNKTDHDEHVSRMHDGTRIVYYCMACKKRGKMKMFKKRQVVVKHIAVKHRLTGAAAINKLIKQVEQNVTSGKELVASSSNSDKTTDAPPPKRLRIEAQGDFLCGKCAFSCSDSEEFSKHISSHNAKQEPQCPECGLCFTVASAMNKHLFAVHKIKEIDEYLKEKGLIESEEEEEEEMDTQPVQVYPLPCVSINDNESSAAKRKTRQVVEKNPLECNVCYKVFDSEATLKTHMRNHGMAFIRSRRHKV